MLRKGGEVPLPRPKKGEGENLIARPIHLRRNNVHSFSSGVWGLLVNGRFHTVGCYYSFHASPFVQLPQINPTANAPRPIDPACHTIWFYQGREEDKSLLEYPPNDDRFTYSGPINTSCR